MLDVAGLTLTQAEKEKINHPNTGAVILFSRNYQDPEQVTGLINAIRAARNGDILIAVDQEGGRVQRFQQGFTRLPPASRYAQNPELAEPAGWLMAAELLAVGVDFSFAPVLDIDCGVSEIIGNRSFSTDPALATQLSSSFRKGMNAAGMAATGKHFPGHGAVALDSHLTLPIDERDLDAIRAKDLMPFKQLIDEGLEGIMPAHVVYPQVDPNPAGFSPFWIQQILRRELNFNGTVFSDDLSMEGAASVGDFPERARLAQLAGCDMILVCNNPAAAEQVLEALPVTHDLVREQRLERMRGKPQMKREQLMLTEKWQQLSSLIINHTL
ncbi:beta-N-acetylhexosaminidase [Candidatus Methylobacter oryzae]|uniref:Beta-hexosaminidase n=1 Tax=Candidatus Methylobacter oryzae TaxID=2497749 RepID=A0ABY3CB80_9GAMM|nr:beta-N-acetylhexosaminidase [Candidatus Methylobacter oryzae]TRW95852.1 beta-N-acetylhexosaminidase [Candidatus Methylobacter oryzae]